MFELIHKQDFVLDSHCDTPGMLLEEIDLGKRQKRGHVDFVRAREGGVDGMFFAIYSPPELTEEEAVAHAVRLTTAVSLLSLSRRSRHWRINAMG